MGCGKCGDWLVPTIVLSLVIVANLRVLVIILLALLQALVVSVFRLLCRLLQAVKRVLTPSVVYGRDLLNTTRRNASAIIIRDDKREALIYKWTEDDLEKGNKDMTLITAAVEPAFPKPIYVSSSKRNNHTIAPLPHPPPPLVTVVRQ